MRLRRIAKLILSTVLLWFLGCTSLPKEKLPPQTDRLPPTMNLESSQDMRSFDYFLLKMADSSKEKNMLWWVEYKRAQLWQEEDPRLSCEKFTLLGKDSEFPLHKLALIQAFALCQQPPTPQPLDAWPAWLQSSWLDAQLAMAKRQPPSAELANLLLEKSKAATNQDEKLKYTTEALAVAEKLNLSELTGELKTRQVKIAPRLNPAPTSQQWLAVAQDFRRARLFNEAEKYYLKITKHSRSDLGQRLAALRGLAQIAKLEGKPDAHLLWLSQTLKQSKPKKGSVAAWRVHREQALTYARALWTQGRGEEAQQFLNLKRKQLIKFVPVAELDWVLGRIAEEKMDFQTAIDKFKLAQSQAPESSELFEKINWALAWNLRKQGKLADAVEMFRVAYSASQNEFAKARFLYWQARTLHELKDTAPAEQVFTQLIEQDPLGYYGLLAHRALSRPIVFVKPKEKTSAPIKLTKNYLNEVEFRWLISLGENDLARLMLDQTIDGLKKSEKTAFDEDLWTEILGLYAQTGDYQRLYERLGKLPAAQRQQILEHHPELLFPQPFESQVTAAANRHAVPAELILAIMRQESSFNPRARSIADAFGLMQLLPSVASRMAGESKLKYEKAEDLFTPDINISLGAYHLKELQDRFKGQLILAIASYNASERAIRNWLTTHYRGDAVSFIEEIPYEETRGYVRLVIRNLIFYQLLRSSAESMPFPDSVLEM